MPNLELCKYYLVKKRGNNIVHYAREITREQFHKFIQELELMPDSK